MEIRAMNAKPSVLDLVIKYTWLTILFPLRVLVTLLSLVWTLLMVLTAGILWCVQILYNQKWMDFVTSRLDIVTDQEKIEACRTFHGLIEKSYGWIWKDVSEQKWNED